MLTYRVRHQPTGHVLSQPFCSMTAAHLWILAQSPMTENQYKVFVEHEAEEGPVVRTLEDSRAVA